MAIINMTINGDTGLFISNKHPSYDQIIDIINREPLEPSEECIDNQDYYMVDNFDQDEYIDNTYVNDVADSMNQPIVITPDIVGIVDSM